MVPEKLESRALFSAAMMVTAVKSPSGNLTVTGTSAADTITVTEVTLPADNDFGVPGGPIVFVTTGVEATPIIAPDGQPFFQGVTSIRLAGKGGDDQLSVFLQDLSSNITGDDGNDNIIVNDDVDENGIGNSIINGGNGDDILGIEHAGTLTVMSGGNGNDEFSVTLAGTNRGSAILFGNNGNDIFTVSGNVIVIGGNGNDTAVVIDGDTRPIIFAENISST